MFYFIKPLFKIIYDKMVEQKRRSLVKALTWRAIATATTMTLVFLFTGEMSLAVGVGALDIIFKLIFYYVHERAWNKLSWGRHKK